MALTPAQRAAIAARYEELANASAVAREFGVDEKTVRNVAGASHPKRSELHARAVSAAIRKARRSLARKVDSIDMYLLNSVDPDGDVPGTIGLEPKDFAAVINSLCNVTAKLLEVEERCESKLLSRLTRDLTRERIKALRGLDQALAGATDEELATVQTILERAKRRGGGSTQGDRDGAGTTESVDPPTGEPR